MVIADVLLAEVLWELLAIELVQVFAGIGQLVRARQHERIVGVVNDALQMWHLYGVYLGGHVVADEEQLGIRVVHDVVNLVSHELMKNGYRDSPVGQCGQESHGPLA